MALEAVVGLAGGYLVGSIPVGLLVCRALGVDIRRYGTGNIGAANVRRNVGFAAALVVAAGVFLQGLAPALLARLLLGPETATAAAAVGSVVGYGWPVFLRFKGGRGVGAATGAAAAISPAGFALLLAAYASGGLLRRIAPAVLAGFAIYAAFVFYSVGSTALRLAALSLLVLIVVRRLEGVGEELDREDLARVLVDRLVHDWRPGQRLSGPSDAEDRR